MIAGCSRRLQPALRTLKRAPTGITRANYRGIINLFSCRENYTMDEALISSLRWKVVFITSMTTDVLYAGFSRHSAIKPPYGGNLSCIILTSQQLLACIHRISACIWTLYICSTSILCSLTIFILNKILFLLKL